MQIAAKVAFYERGTDRVPFHLTGREAAIKLNLGLLEVRASTRKRGVIAVQSSGVAVDAEKLGARPGSYGIKTDHLPSGHFCFAHHRAELQAA